MDPTEYNAETLNLYFRSLPSYSRRMNIDENGDEDDDSSVRNPQDLNAKDEQQQVSSDR